MCVHMYKFSNAPEFEKNREKEGRKKEGRKLGRRRGEGGKEEKERKRWRK